MSKRCRHLWNAHGQCQWCKTLRPADEAARQAADRERRRIRRAQTNERNDLLRLRLTLLAAGMGVWAASVNDIEVSLDAATRAPRRK